MGTKAVAIGNGKRSYNEALAPSVAHIVAAASASSTQSAALGVGTHIVRLSSDVACFIAIGASPTATRSTSVHLPAGVVEKFVVTPADKIAVIANTTVGTLFICEPVEIGS